MWNTVFPYILSGISVGGQYALIAIGYTMVYGILRLINFAHGDVFMVAGIIMVYMAASGVPLWLCIPLVLVLTALIGFVIERLAYKPLRSAPRMSAMISAIGVSYTLQNLVLYITGGLNQLYPTIPWISDSVTIFGATTKMVTVVTPILTIVLVVGLVQLINHTKIGMAMRAVSRDFETSQLMGIKINSVISMTFVIGTFLAGVASLLYFTNYTTVIQTSGAMPGLKAFVAAVFGGIGSIPGAVVGAFIIGIAENIIKGLDVILFKAGILSGPVGLATFSDAFTFALLIIILAVKPTGLFGEKITDTLCGARNEQQYFKEKGGFRHDHHGGHRPLLLRRGVYRGAKHPGDLHAVHGPEKGRDLRAGGRVHEPAERLHGHLLAGPGGLHAGGRLCLRHTHDPHRLPDGRVPVL